MTPRQTATAMLWLARIAAGCLLGHTAGHLAREYSHVRLFELGCATWVCFWTWYCVAGDDGK